MIASRSWNRLLQILPMTQVSKRSDVRVERRAKVKGMGMLEAWEQSLTAQANLMFRELDNE